MPAPNPKVVALEKQLAVQTKNLTALHADLDAAADADDKPLIIQLQSEIAASEALIKSAERRLAAALKQETAEAKKARKAENLAAVKLVRDGLIRQQKAAPRVVSAVRELVAAMEDAHSAGRAARTSLASLVSQLPQKQSEHFWALLNSVEGSVALGVVLESELQKAGIFTDLAPNAGVVLRRLDVDSDQFFEKRTRQLSSAVAHLAERVNGEIGE